MFHNSILVKKRLGQTESVGFHLCDVFLASIVSSLKFQTVYLYTAANIVVCDGRYKPHKLSYQPSKY